ncbi:MAG: PHP domain-containing protein [Ktedonobacterales bacterium]
MDVTLDASVDLQLHTVYSDGQWLPGQLFEYLAAERFSVISITDHDTVAHLDELSLLGESRGITVLPGVEVTSRWRGMIAHVLCYAVGSHFTGEALEKLVDETREQQLENTWAVYVKLEEQGYAFPRRGEVLSADRGGLVRPIDNARLLLHHGYASDVAQALGLIAGAGYVIVASPIEASVEAAHACGAVALLAHPGRGGDGGEIPQYPPEMVAEMLGDAPLDGIEVYYPTHSPQQTEAYHQLATEHGLLVSAGSDSHGPEQRLPVHYRVEQCRDLLLRCGIDITNIT